jgi:hypothetical protein
VKSRLTGEEVWALMQNSLLDRLSLT